MKKLLILAILLSAFVLLTTSASAALTVSDVSLGSSTQDRGATLTGTVTLTNTDKAKSLDTVALTSTAASKYNVAFSAVSPTTITAGGTATATLTLTVPLDHNAVDASLAAVSLEVGKITATAKTVEATPTPVSGQGSLKVQAKNNLLFRKGRVKVSGVSTFDKSFSRSSRVTDLRPGDKLNLDVEVENTFPDKSDGSQVDFRDAKVKLEFSTQSDIDSDEDDDDVSVDAGDKETATFSFKIENDARDRAVTVFIKIEGKDSNGATHGEDARLTLDVKREAHDLVIRSAELNPSKVVCDGQREIQVTANVLNRGKVDEDEAGFEVRVSGLGVMQKSPLFKVDEDDSKTVTLSFDVPKDAKAGTFNVDFASLYDNTVKSNIKTATLVVEDCKKKEEAKQPEPVVVVQTPQPVTSQPVVPLTAVKAKTSEFGDTNTYLLLLGVGVVVVVVLIIALLAIAFKRR